MAATEDRKPSDPTGTAAPAPSAAPDGALPPTPPVDPADLVLITNPSLEGGAVTTVPRRAYEGLWRNKGFVLVEDDRDVVAAGTGQVFLKDDAQGKYTDVSQDGVKSATADIANQTVVTPGPRVPGSAPAQ